MPTYRLTVAYDGTDFHGWAPQPGLRTVAGELARALELDPRELTVAGRTDTGVHAQANVVSLAAARLLPAVALNDRLPADIAVSRGGAGRRLVRRPQGRPRPKLRLPPEHGPEPRSAARRATSSTTPVPWIEPPSTRAPRPSPAPTTSRRSRRTETEHVHFDRTVIAAEWRARRRPARVPHHRRRLPAPHGARAGRDDARPAGPRAPRRRSWPAGPARTPAARPRRTASPSTSVTY